MARASIHNLQPGARVYLMGICGTAMASLAGLLKELGYEVSGSDLNPYPPMSTQLASLGIEVKKGYVAENLHPAPDFVIVGNVISLSNPEAQELNRMDLPFASLPQALGELLLQNHQTLVVAGTHGKTTTTSLLAWVLTKTQSEAPGFLIGGIPKNFTKSFQIPRGKYFAIEGDEYDTAYFDKVPKFIHYHPRHAILTSIEFDHADIYKDLADVQKAFVRLLEVLRRPGNETGELIYSSDDRHTRELVRARADTSLFFSYGLNPAHQPNYYATDLQVSEKGTRFRVRTKSSGGAEVNLGAFLMPLPGDYNVNNALAVIALAHRQNWDMKIVASALESFAGVKRRQDILGEPNGILVIEDFAHHPTAVRETLAGIQKKYPARKFFSVFEPRSATSRRKVFQKDYVEAFAMAKDVVIKTTYDQSRIDEADRFSSAELVRDIEKRGVSAREFSTVDGIIEYLITHSKSGDGILLMSNGGFDGIYEKLLKALAGKKA